MPELNILVQKVHRAPGYKQPFSEDKLTINTEKYPEVPKYPLSCFSFNLHLRALEIHSCFPKDGEGQLEADAIL